jgi:response regulator RpfG family c-di-GMP phosphodiesterase
VTAQRVGINKRIADCLLRDAVIDQTDYIRSIEHAKRKGIRVEDALVELDVVDEQKLLKYVATLHKTQFVSTERMSKAKIDRAAIEAIPRGVAQHYGVFPLVLDRMNDKLVVATADPDDEQARRELTLAARVTRIMMMVARPVTVLAAIERAYKGDGRRFKQLLLKERTAEIGDMLLEPEVMRDSHLPREPVGDLGDMLPPAERGRLRRERNPDRPSTGEFAPPRRRTGEASEPPPADRLTPRARVEGSRRRTGPRMDDTVPAPIVDHPADAPAPRRTGPGQPPPRPASSIPPEPESDEDGWAAAAHGVPAAPAVPRDLRAADPQPKRHRSKGRLSVLPGRPAPRSGDEDAVFASPSYLETLRVLVGLLENERLGLRGHSGIVARLAKDICERIALPEQQAHEIVLASYLHDLGKMGSLHLTALNVAQSGEHLEMAMKVVALPQQLMESVGLPEATVHAMRHMYERMGGGGLPDGLAGKDISIGARILALADSYADLTRNGSNEYGRMLTPEEALDVLMQHAASVFDSNILSVLQKATGGEKILTGLLTGRHRALVVDPDPEETMVLQLRLVEQGFDVNVARTVEEARRAIHAGDLALVVSEVDIDEPEGGFTLRQEAQKRHPTLSWVFLSRRDSRDVAKRAFELGVDDFIAKPVSPEILVAKLMQLVERQSTRVAPRGVKGSLAEMALPDIVQILWHGRKTCRLRVSQGDKRGEIHFSQGQIVNARWGDAQGDVAFYRLLALGEEGEFGVDPEFKPSGERVIHGSPEALLLEGMRLLDEGMIP